MFDGAPCTTPVGPVSPVGQARAFGPAAARREGRRREADRNALAVRLLAWADAPESASREIGPASYDD